MAKFKLSLPLRISDLRDYLCRMQHELSLMKNAYRAAGATTAQGQMLLEIERSGPLNVINLTALLGLDKSTVSQTLAQLQRNGWIQLVEDQRDRRYKTIHLTEEGMARTVAIQEQFDFQLNEIIGSLSEQERNAIVFGIGLFTSVLETNRVEKTTRRDLSTATANKHHPLYQAREQQGSAER